MRLTQTILLWLLAVSAPVAAGVVSESWSAGDSGGHPRSVTVADRQGGALMTIKLTGLPKDAKVKRAWLVARREMSSDPDKLVKTIEIRPGKSGNGRPLALVGPWQDRFDATDAVRAAAAAGELRLLVTGFAGWDRASTRLEVLYEAKGAKSRDVPPAATGLRAFHRAGQTFLTWNEAKPLWTKGELTWGRYRKLLAEAGQACSYRIYAADKPISAETLAGVEFVAEVPPLSCWNAHDRNTEYLIGQAMIRPDKIGELAMRHMRGTTGQYHNIRPWSMDEPRMARYPLRRFAVDEQAGPLPPGTGLYVHNPAAPGKRYYAVVACRAGVENTAEFSPANALASPVAETVGLGEPVRQGKGLWGPFFDYRGERHVYVQWCAPPLSPRPNMYFNWTVMLPPDCVDDSGWLKQNVAAKFPAEVYFHSRGFSHAKPRQKYLLDSIQIAPQDYPASGWYGFNDAWGTLKSLREGTVRNHTQRRIAGFLDWAGKTFPVDTKRIIAAGGDGAAMLALAYPDRFAYVLIDRFENEVLANDASARFSPAWGPSSPEIKDDRGRGEWSWAMLDTLVGASPDVDLPLFVCRGYSWGPFLKGFARGYGRFYEAMLAARTPLVADWTWASGKLVRPDKYTGRWRGLDLTSTTPVPAFSNCSTDNNKESDGQHNLLVTWDGVKDEPDGFTIELNAARDATFDMVPRRLQNFKVSPGQKLRWEARAELTRTDKQPKPMSGEVTVDGRGRIILTGIKIRRRAKLTVKVTRSE